MNFFGACVAAVDVNIHNMFSGAIEATAHIASDPFDRDNAGLVAALADTKTYYAWNMEDVPVVRFAKEHVAPLFQPTLDRLAPVLFEKGYTPDTQHHITLAADWTLHVPLSAHAEELLVMRFSMGERQRRGDVMNANVRPTLEHAKIVKAKTFALVDVQELPKLQLQTVAVLDITGSLVTSFDHQGKDRTLSTLAVTSANPRGISRRMGNQTRHVGRELLRGDWTLQRELLRLQSQMRHLKRKTGRFGGRVDSGCAYNGCGEAGRMRGEVSPTSPNQIQQFRWPRRVSTRTQRTLLETNVDDEIDGDSGLLRFSREFAGRLVQVARDFESLIDAHGNTRSLFVREFIKNHINGLVNFIAHNEEGHNAGLLADLREQTTFSAYFCGVTKVVQVEFQSETFGDYVQVTAYRTNITGEPLEPLRASEETVIHDGRGPNLGDVFPGMTIFNVRGDRESLDTSITRLCEEEGLTMSMIDYATSEDMENIIQQEAQLAEAEDDEAHAEDRFARGRGAAGSASRGRFAAAVRSLFPQH